MNLSEQTPPGRLIIFEGPDASGKTTASKALVDFFNRNGRACIWRSFPGLTPGSLGHFVYSFHHDERSERIAPISLQFLHLAAHMNLIKNEILPALLKGTWVVLDRYWWSTHVYGLASGAEEAPLKLGIAAEKHVWGNVSPSLVFFVNRNFDELPEEKTRRNRLTELYWPLVKAREGVQAVEVIPNDQSLQILIERVQQKALLHFPHAQDGQEE